jgi:hypothetical protein
MWLPEEMPKNLSPKCRNIPKNSPFPLQVIRKFICDKVSGCQ